MYDPNIQESFAKIYEATAVLPQKNPTKTFFLPKVRFEGYERIDFEEIETQCVFIDKLAQLDILDEILDLEQGEIVGINVQMNADSLNENLQIDVFGPSLLTLGSTNKIYILDFARLCNNSTYGALDKKLCYIF